MSTCGIVNDQIHVSSERKSMSEIPRSKKCICHIGKLSLVTICQKFYVSSERDFMSDSVGGGHVKP